MEGFTGLDVQRARTDISNFLESAGTVQLKIRKAHEVLFHTLVKKWASPKAIKYTTSVVRDYADLEKSFQDTYQLIADEACAAGHRLAKSHGAVFNDTMSLGGFPALDTSDWICSEALYGVTGMDTEGVRIAVSTYVSSMNSCKIALEGLPKGIAFYDPANNLIDSYDRNVQNFADKFIELMTSIENSMNTYMNDEADQILFAKNEAQDIMSVRA